MNPGNAPRRSTRRWYLIASYVIVAVYVAGLGVATDELWRHKLIHDAGTLGAYSTAVLAVSTIVLFAATAVLAAATIELGRAERDSARREEEKYEQEREARLQEHGLRDEQMRVYKLQLVELHDRLAIQERAQAELVHATSADVTISLRSGTTLRSRVLRVENRSHLPIRHCESGARIAEGNVCKARAGNLAGALTDTLARFSERSTETPITMRPEETIDFILPHDDSPGDGLALFVEFDDAYGRRWRLDDQLNLSRAPRSAPVRIRSQTETL